ncbi:MAG: GUN4 domain-containing protein [Cyanobacteria bacterium]|nr:GUN4 domain-containing protein [Cyanobacteriota bacterium]
MSAGKTPPPPSPSPPAGPPAISCCPVCQSEYSERETMHCFTCGWYLMPLPSNFTGAAAAVLASREQVRLAWAREAWSKTQLTTQLNQVHAQLKRARHERAQIHSQLQQVLRGQQEGGLELMAQTLLQVLDGVNRLQDLVEGGAIAADPVPGGASGGASLSPAALSAIAVPPAIPSGSPPVTAYPSPAPAPIPASVPRGATPNSPFPPDPEEVTLLQFEPVAANGTVRGADSGPRSPLPSFSMAVDRGKGALAGAYQALEQLLAQGQWREADIATTQIMLEVVGREKASWLRVEDIENFPPQDLKMLDELWSRYSKNRFGFSTQNRLWTQIVARSTSPVEAWCEFGDALGWHANKSLTFSLKAPAGHLPYCSSVGIWWCSGLFPRAIAAATAQ